MSKLKILLAVTLTGLILFALSRYARLTNSGVTNSTKPVVVASFYPLYYFASQIAGSEAEVYNLTPAGTEPHDFEPTARDLALVSDSKLLILNGSKLEPWGVNIADSLVGSPTAVINTSESLANQSLNVNGTNTTDPHIWLDPVLAQKQVATILAGFIKIDPEHANYYTTNAKELTAKLSALDQAYRAGLKSCGSEIFVTSHAAFGYLAEEYGLTQLPIGGLSPDSEPSADKLSKLADFAKQNNVHYIFFESLVSPKLAEALASEINAQTLVLNPLEGLTASEQAAGQNYFTVMQNNLNNLRTALACL